MIWLPGLGPGPGGDRLLFWDQSAATVDWLTPGSGVTITGTTLTASGGGGGGSTNIAPVDNVKATYGAIGNGTSDDTAAISAAITAAAASGGTGIVYFPPGVYITSPIVVPNAGITFQGAGGQGFVAWDTTVYNPNTHTQLKLKSGSTGPLLSPANNNVTHINVRDLALNCNGIYNSGGCGIHLPDGASSVSREWHIERVYVYNVNMANTGSGAAIHIGSGNGGCILRDVIVFNGMGGYPNLKGCNGVEWYGTDGYMERCWIGGFNVYGLLIYGGTNDISFYWNAGGVFWSGFADIGIGGSGAVISGVSIDSSLQCGVFVGQAGSTTTFMGCTFHDNSSSSNGGYPDILIGANNVKLGVVGCRQYTSGTNKPSYVIDNGTNTGCVVDVVATHSRSTGEYTAGFSRNI